MAPLSRWAREENVVCVGRSGETAPPLGAQVSVDTGDVRGVYAFRQELDDAKTLSLIRESMRRFACVSGCGRWLRFP